MTWWSGLLLPECQWRSGACSSPSTCRIGLVLMGFDFLLPRLLLYTSAASEASPPIRTYSCVVIGYVMSRRHFFWGGLLFDKCLTWVPHLRTLKVSCLKALDLLRVLGHMSWGADRATLLCLYHVLIRSKLVYGSEVYFSATDAHLRVLESVHHAGVRLETGAFRSSPIPSLLVDADEPPLDLRRQSLMVRCWHQLHRLPDSLPCLAVSSDIMSQYYFSHPRTPWPFGF
ncbi:hypothetical protein Pcinc_008646 [Petrolisthes cinctipes]|uniref:Uncharacterized protein n=1 Tax=Petrolisthes cinctipes TaxID=88211 RepID=A0AAE1G6Z2_PETCI|nr:hypothetical protein Pcinc_008646 [Petrolisthes cinctipes]